MKILKVTRPRPRSGIVCAVVTAKTSRIGQVESPRYRAEIGPGFFLQHAVPLKDILFDLKKSREKTPESEPEEVE